MKTKESPKHKEIKRKIAKFIEGKGFDICMEGDDHCILSEVKNPGNIGDGENKRPDVEGSYNGRIFKRGEAKLEEDLATEHSITQYKLFARRSDLVIGVPKGVREKLEEVLKENLNKEEREAVKTILEF